MRFTASKPLSCFPKLFRPNSLKSPIGKAQSEGRKNNKQTIRTALNRRSSSDSNAEGAEGGGGTFLLFMHLRKKIFIFRDIFDIPPISGSVSIHEVVTETIDNLNRMYPDLMPGYPILKMKERNTHQGLICLYHVLECMADSWVEDKSMRDKFKKPHIETSPLDELVELVLVMLDCINKAAKERFESMDAERKHKHSGSIRLKPYPKPSVDCNSEHSKSPASLSPRTPNSVLPDSPRFADLLGAMLGSYSPHQLLNLRVQAVEELSPMDLKRLVVHVMPHFAGKGNFHQNLKSASMEEEAKIEARDNALGEKNGRKTEGEKHDHEAKETENPTPTENEDEVVDMVQPPALPEKAVSTPSSAPPPPLMRASTNPSPLGSYIHPPPPPPSPSYSPPPSPSASTSPPPPLVPGAAPPPLSGKKIHPPPPGPTMKGAAPPPPGGMRTVVCPRNKTKLKRSSHMGNLYRILRGRVEGSCLPGGKSSPGNKNVINGNASNGGSAGGGGTGMADALAEMTKRSTYFQHIEEDMDKHRKAIKELQRDLYVFKTRDMDELLKFHNHVESLLEVLTDETQILSKFPGFPMNKLETLRMAAALSTKLNGIVSEIQNWKIEPPLAENLDKVEKYFSKIKAELEGIERTKDENSKLFESQNIHFDLSILTKIKECMVDLSSGFIELALEERREEKASSKPDGKHASSVRMLWRAFQFAFKVYSFAGGQDERADSLTTELAKEIETHPIQE